MGPGDLSRLVSPLAALANAGGRGREILVGPETGDDAGVLLFGGRGLVATADFITPVCDDAERFGRIAAANSLSDVYAMGGSPLFALNLCCFPDASGAPEIEEALAGILRGAALALRDAGAALLGGHTVRDEDLKFGLAVVGEADPHRLITNAGARAGDRLVLTKPLGTGVLINAFKADRLDEEGLEPALREMERLNAAAAEAALAHGVRGGVDVTGFGLAGHALALARASRVALRLDFDALPAHPGFYDRVRAGVTTGCTESNRRHAEDGMRIARPLRREEEELLFDPQTSGGLLLSAPAESAENLLHSLIASGHQAALVGSVLAPSRGATVLEIH